MTPLVIPALDLSGAIARLNRDLTQASAARNIRLAKDRLAVCRFLAREIPTIPTRDLAARAEAVTRFLGGRT